MNQELHDELLERAEVEQKLRAESIDKPEDIEHVTRSGCLWVEIDVAWARSSISLSRSPRRNSSRRG